MTVDVLIKPRAYSYIRFSTPEQALGDSERRQIDAAKRFAESRNLEFADMVSHRDKGLSGYHGTHRKKGKLGEFLRAVEAGQIPPGSILVVEELRRLSREGVVTTLREIIFKLWDHGITLHTLEPKETYEPGCDGSPKFIGLWIYLEQACRESRDKSHWLQEAWKEKRRKAHESNVLLTEMKPAWLRVEGEKTDTKDDRKFVVIHEAAETVSSIFEMKLQGLSRRKIGTILNESATWARKKGWRESYVLKILGNRAVIGEYQPHVMRDGKRVPEGEPIQGYFPAIVDPATFHNVQVLLAANKGKGGQNGKCSNLFSHIVKCAYCGASMRFIDKGKPPRGAKYLVCDRAARKMGCQRHMVRYDEFERTVLEFAYKLKPEQVLPNQNENQKICNTLRQKIQGRAAEHADMRKQIENLTDQIARTESRSARDRYELRTSQLEETAEAVEADIAQSRTALKAAEEGMASMINWQANLETLCNELQNGDPLLRMRLRAHLHEFIERIEVFGVGYKEQESDLPVLVAPARGKRVPQTREDIGEYLEAMAAECWPDGSTNHFDDFVDYVVARRMSKEGRFYRVYWKTGGWLDAVPPASLASGMKVVPNKHGKTGHFCGPDVSQLWTSFTKAMG